MKVYNEKDVEILEKVFIKLLPWIPSFPNISVYKGEDKCCSYCGSNNVIEDKYFYTNSNKYKVYRCKDCNSLSRSRVGEYKNKSGILMPLPR